MSQKIPIAVTMGDPAGIGPELCLKVLADPAVLERCRPVVFGDVELLRRVAEPCGLSMPDQILALDAWKQGSNLSGPCVIDCGAVDAAEVEPGMLNAACGRAAFAYVEAAIESALAKRVAGVATAPIHKEALNLAGVPHPGHTEIFAELTKAERVCMMLYSDAMACSFVTTHLGQAQVSKQLSVQRIVDVIELSAEAIGRLRGRRARIGVCALNPHAGEHGLFGREEQKYIEPAIKAAVEKGLDVVGPFSPDAAFLPSLRERTDCYVCMYHDQGHIPFKMLAFDQGVNVSLGLPIVRTSVDHGTAFDIAWTGRASPQSLVQAILVAVNLASRN